MSTIEITRGLEVPHYHSWHWPLGLCRLCVEHSISPIAHRGSSIAFHLDLTLFALCALGPTKTARKPLQSAKLTAHLPACPTRIIKGKEWTGRLVGAWATPLKNMSSSIGMISNPILMGK